MSVKFIGVSNNEYFFEEYRLENLPHYESVVYIYAKKEGTLYAPLYIGETGRDIWVRYIEHESDGVNTCVETYGFNCMLLLLVPLSGIDAGESSRKRIEDDLLKKYKTPCNIKNN